MPIVIGKRRKQSKKFDVIARMIEETGKAVAGYKTAKKEAATAAEKKKRDEQDREFELMARQLGYDVDLLKYNQMLDAAARAPYERAEAERQKAREYRDQKMAEMRAALDRMHGRRIQEEELGIQKQRLGLEREKAAAKAGTPFDPSINADALAAAVKERAAQKAEGLVKTRSAADTDWYNKKYLTGSGDVWKGVSPGLMEVTAEDLIPVLQIFQDTREEKLTNEQLNQTIRWARANWAQLGFKGDPPSEQEWQDPRYTQPTGSVDWDNIDALLGPMGGGG